MLVQNYTGQRRDSGEEVVFPVTWPDAEAAARVWRWDAEHSPFPLTPLSQEFSRGIGGPAVAVESLGGTPPPATPPVSANGYRYNEGRDPFGPRTQAYLETVAEMAPRVGELWDQGWRLEIAARGREIRAFNYDSLSLPELVTRLESMAEGVRENMVLMFRASHLVNYSRGQLLEFCKAHIGEAAESFLTDLLQGTQTESLESGAALWDTAQTLARNAAALKALRSQPNQDGLARLREIEGANDFLAQFNDWLESYGHRNGSFGELAEPTWFEDPRVAIALVLQSAGATDPRVSQGKAIKVRGQLQREFEKRLGEPATIRSFRTLLKAAEPYLGVRESRDHAVNAAFTAIRQPALNLGRRLVERATIENSADVFFLRFGDLEAAAQDPSSDLRALVAERRNSYEYWCNVAPPVTIGTTAPGEVDPKFIRGVAASGGVVTGTARVIMTLTDADVLRAGEILVTRSTTPAWTPLFGTAAAVVTEGGGALSHCAILAREYGIPAVVGMPYSRARMAREYGIPAVVGASGASLRIPNGATITVDGTRGRVIISEESE